MAATQANAVQEYSIRVPKNVKKSFKVMRFNSSVNVDFTKWSQVKMERENNMKEYQRNEDEQPKFGAGSEFGRDAREEARRRKFGINTKKYRPEDQPWILKVGGKAGKKFKGTREGGVAENAAYYIFTHARDGGIEAFPVQEWYNFQPTQRYKSLSAEEAELEFGRRNKQVNYFSLMLRKRLRGDDDGDADDGEDGKMKAKGKSKKGELKISEMDDWEDSDDDKGSESKEEESETEEKKKPKKTDAKQKKKKKDPLDEAFEESDDGDEEGREVDYISDSSDSDSDHETKVNKQLQGVAEEDALRKLLSSGEEDEDEEKEKEEGKDSEGEDKHKSEGGGAKDDKDKKSKKKKHESKKKKEDGTVDSSSDTSSDSSDSEAETKKKQNGSKSLKESNSGASSRSGTPTQDVSTGDNNKRKTASAIESINKKMRLDNFASASVTPLSINSNESGITEDAVRRYLMRKPMTTTELLHKFKSKKTGLTSEQLVNIMTQILKRINPVKQMIKGKMYLSIKG